MPPPSVSGLNVNIPLYNRRGKGDSNLIQYVNSNSTIRKNLRTKTVVISDYFTPNLLSVDFES